MIQSIPPRPRSLKVSQSWTRIYKWGVLPTQPLRHVCDNPCCVNADHLFEANQRTDAYDKRLKKKGAVLIDVFTAPYEMEESCH